MEPAVDSAFIRSAVELADLNAVRVALYQATKDPELAALPTAINLTDDQRELLIEKAVTWLESNAGPGMPPEPPEDELRQLMNMATARRDARPGVRGAPRSSVVQGLPVDRRLDQRQAEAARTASRSSSSEAA